MANRPRLGGGLGLDDSRELLQEVRPETARCESAKEVTMAKAAKTFLAMAILTLGLAMLEPDHKAHASSAKERNTALQGGTGKAAAGDLGAGMNARARWVLDSTHLYQTRAIARADQLRAAGWIADVTYENGLYYTWRWQR
jgi:hypothetical protein